VFTSDKPVLLRSELTFLPWAGGSEGEFNEHQAEEPDFYFGDEVFAKTGSGKVECVGASSVGASQNLGDGSP